MIITIKLPCKVKIPTRLAELGHRTAFPAPQQLPTKVKFNASKSFLFYYFIFMIPRRLCTDELIVIWLLNCDSFFPFTFFNFPPEKNSKIWPQPIHSTHRLKPPANICDFDWPRWQNHLRSVLDASIAQQCGIWMIVQHSRLNRTWGGNHIPEKMGDTTARVTTDDIVLAQGTGKIGDGTGAGLEIVVIVIATGGIETETAGDRETENGASAEKDTTTDEVSHLRLLRLLLYLVVFEGFLIDFSF